MCDVEVYTYSQGNILKINSQGGWNSKVEGWKNLENLIAGGGWSFVFTFFVFQPKKLLTVEHFIYSKI